jgi:hypothetical protein
MKNQDASTRMQHSHQTIFYSENQTMTFSYTRFPVNKINVEKIFKIMRKSLFSYSFYSHPEIWKFQGVTGGGAEPESREGGAECKREREERAAGKRSAGLGFGQGEGG